MEKVAIIGIGRLGLCLALNLEAVGYKVLGLDVNETYIKELNSKTFRSEEPLVNEFLLASKNFRATKSLDDVILENHKVIIVVLPTPSLSNGQFNHSYIDDLAKDLILKTKPNQTEVQLIINSTTMPGYCDQLQKQLSPYNYKVSYSPEFIAQGSIIHNQQNPDQILIGEADKISGDIIEALYLRISKNKPVVCRMNRRSAEITKLATNCFLTTKIAFANAIGDIAKSVGGEAEKILKAIGADSRIGQKYFNYGFGYGGPCFPRDNKAFAAFAEGMGYKMNISIATDQSNEQHAEFLFKEALNENSNSGKIIFDSVTYKKGTNIIEESQQLKLALMLAKAGKKIVIRESNAVILLLQKQFGNLFDYELNEE